MYDDVTVFLLLLKKKISNLEEDNNKKNHVIMMYNVTHKLYTLKKIHFLSCAMMFNFRVSQ